MNHWLKRDWFCLFISLPSSVLVILFRNHLYSFVHLFSLFYWSWSFFKTWTIRLTFQVYCARRTTSCLCVFGLVVVKSYRDSFGDRMIHWLIIYSLKLRLFASFICFENMRQLHHLRFIWPVLTVSANFITFFHHEKTTSYIFIFLSSCLKFVLKFSR